MRTVANSLACGLLLFLSLPVGSAVRDSGPLWAQQPKSPLTASQPESPGEALRRQVADASSADPEAESRRSMIYDQQRTRLQAANDASRQAWSKIRTRPQWEAYSRPRIEALARSLGEDIQSAPEKKLRWEVVRQHSGSGYVIQNVVYESRPGWWVTANLYLPADPDSAAVRSWPAIVICHSHHRPKEHGELQDMGMTWARKGCAVLVPDQPGHGERRQHPFASERDSEHEFRVSRQDYYFRYDTGIQLHLVGESLVGWMAWDMMRGIDLLESIQQVDPERIALLGAVAGGGDPAAVTAAIDRRVAVAAPFNFGGPQPETRFPLPDDAETSFNYAGSGSWESTRNLRRSAGDGFLPWVIVASIAPRRLIFSHEFNWDQPRDPVWKRLQKVYGFYDTADRLDYTHGRGELRGRPPEATHCTHIGAPHRVRIHQALARWFDVPVWAEDEFSARLEAEQLRCLTPEVVKRLEPQPLTAILPALAEQRQAALRRQRDRLAPDARRSALLEQWSAVLGIGAEVPRPEVRSRSVNTDGPWKVERIVLRTEPGIDVPLVILRSPDAASPDVKGEASPTPVVLGLAESGKEGFLQERSEEILRLLEQGYAVCLPDLRGTGETRSGSDRGRRSAATSRSSTELMLGTTMVGQRLQDARAVVRYLHDRDEFDSQRIRVWGASFAPVNSDSTQSLVPRGIGSERMPKQCEPLGGFLALLLAVYEPESVSAIYLDRGLVDFHAVLRHPLVLIPHDVVVPGLLAVGDLPDLAEAARQPIGGREFVDHLNRLVDFEAVRARYPSVQRHEDPVAWFAEESR